jgi:hypothetical protein
MSIWSSIPFRLLMCAFVLVAAAASAHAVPLTTPLTPEAALAAKCKAASFARRPAGQMATTMRDLQIQRCIKNKGYLD